MLSKEEKELLLKDLCVRLPYGVKLQNINDIESIVKLRYIDLDDYCCEIVFYSYQGKALTICNKSKLFRFGNILRYKPYLFPLSSITEEQKKYIADRWGINENFDFEIDPNWGKYFVELGDVVGFINWCYENHLDINGLIPKGLAEDATDKNIY